MTASVHFFSVSHARNRSSSFTLVPNRRTSSAGFRSAGPVKTQTAKNFFSHIDSRTVFNFDFQHGFSFRRETDAFMSFCLADLLAPIGVLRRPDYFPNGVVSTIFQIGHFSSY